MTGLNIMKRATTLAFAFISVCLLLVGDAHADRPNIVLILADDVSAGMFSCYGHGFTPKVKGPT